MTNRSQPDLSRHKPELLAPAGKEEVFHAVLAAGADAVYLAGKRFNMRRHRSDFNFTDEALPRLIAEAHRLGRRVYVTVNSLVGPGELADLERCLRELAEFGPDALIVQDLAVVELCRRHRLPLALHASTMMNVGSAAAARFLRGYGFTRVVTSRDLTVEAVRRIREEAGIEVEYFVHGDMCSVQSGQCCTSGIVFGKSSNRGQCMKPCRWAYDLVSEASGQPLARNAYLLAAKDMCLLQQVPDLMTAGVDAFKIEGRMKPADVLAPIVAAYRRVIDRCWESPLAPAKTHEEAADLHRRRVREMTTGYAFATPGPAYVDVTGEREVLFLSRHGTLPALTAEETPFRPTDGRGAGPAAAPTITCVAGTATVAWAAIEAGAADVILAWEGDLRVEAAWILDEIEALAVDARRQGARVLLSSPAIVTEREYLEWSQALARLPAIEGVVLSHYSLLEVPSSGVPSPGPQATQARLSGGGPLEEGSATGTRAFWAGAGMNLLNPVAAEFLVRHGATRLQPGIEAGLAEVLALAAAPGLVPLDLLVHGPLTGMIVEHCLPAMATQRIGKREFCQMPCATDSYALVDASGNRRALRCDRYCRNHILLERDLGLLPFLEAFRVAGVASWRIDARLYTPEKTAALVDLYRRAAQAPAVTPALAAEFWKRCPPETLTAGAYPSGVTGDDAISLAGLKSKERHESVRAKAG